MINIKKNKILLGLSGGVDSSVAAFLLKKRGYEVIGLYFKMINNQEEDIKRIKKIACQLKIELIVKDLTREFKQEVISYFLKEYQLNKTPNPCVVCNSKIKFQQLIRMADSLNIEKIATGHYAQIEIITKEKKDCFLLKKAADLKKDQSYFLHQLKQAELKRTLFPLGKHTKEEVNKINKINKIISEEVKESQDICFFSGQENLKSFFNKQEIKTKKGLILNEEKEILGEHRGLIYYTQGQRYGLNLSGGPFYVIKKKKNENQLIVSKNKKHILLNNFKLRITGASWVFKNPVLNKEYRFKSRYRARESAGVFSRRLKDGNWEILLKTPQWAVAKGQFLVIYEKDKLVGGGVLL